MIEAVAITSAARTDGGENQLAIFRRRFIERIVRPR